MATKHAGVSSGAPAPSKGSDYEVPFVHVRVPQGVGNAVFWLGVVGTVAAGIVELPVAALVTAGVIVVRHRSPVN